MLYDLGFLIFSLFYLPTLIFKGRLHKDFAERFGLYSKSKKALLRSCRNAIWIQAVSVGEVSLCRALIPSLQRAFPGKEIVLSTITNTGNGLALKLFSKDATVIYFPLDFSFIVKKTVALIRPSLYIMIETEIWPNLLAELARSGVPSVMVNGRISDKSFGKYMLVSGFLKKTLTRIALFGMQSALDAERICSMGAESSRTRITGNMKFDTVPLPGPMAQEEELFVAGSTHRGEEEAIIGVFGRLAEEFPDLKLLIAPRHIERAAEIESIAKKRSLLTVRVSQLTTVCCTQSAARILILDSIGQLAGFYRRAKVVFIGGSLVRHGGQNPIEPASFGKAVIFGPHMFNFRDVAALFLKKSAAFQISDTDGLLEKVLFLLRDKSERDKLGQAARAVVEENRGATEKNMEMIDNLIRK